MATDRANLKKLTVGYVGSSPSSVMSDAIAAVAAANSRVYRTTVNDGGVAGTAVTNSPFAVVPYAGLVKSIKFSAPIAVTGSDTTFATITVSKSTAGATPVVLGTATTQVTGGLGSLVAFQQYALTLSTVAGALDIAANDVLTVAVAKASTGVALVAATSLASVSALLEEV